MSFDIKDELLQKIRRFTLKEAIDLTELDKHEFKDELLQKIRMFTSEEAIYLAKLDKHKFKQLLVIAKIRNFIQELEDNKEIFTTLWDEKPNNRSIDFGPIDWGNSITSETDEIIKLSKYYIYFKFNYTHNKSDDIIKIILQIGSQEDTYKPLIRDRIFELANNDQLVNKHSIFKRWKKNLGKERKIIYENKKLQEINYKDGNIENIMKEAENIWQDFINNDFVEIKRMIADNKEYIINGNSARSS
ncbi:hypothetical protein MEN41_13970 [Dolichospermum sp. ST_con]|nr:hypothetical protein [Dolichospermum sp. ST_con]MDD1420081.1 hypothetical protein [Dolichospermum sp. ST_sed1]MDD1426094.1 hypothetical protein [Dolichospermum sp. ST_sed9]MDD1430311.1 hypothetical protein [Dolichospermum sp. ST_sed6]MDD1437109.1 hypothetical protein [Dolichospermum sp. ST_sed10]MDD1441873.1 hypothetical protein [Dolichospermum sp. ST_sed3]MDD1447615.1 hypothetical protein [Dolichospermum sp. ST_sed8]MDD1455941.1 hypothetical protein [Dolichospermum sp. ST_sed7]MDD146132